MTAPAASADAPPGRSLVGTCQRLAIRWSCRRRARSPALLVIGPEQFVNALTIGAIYALVAIGYTMVYGIIELINFAHGDVFMVGAFVQPLAPHRRLGFTGADQRAGPPGRPPGRRSSSFTSLVMGLVGVLIERSAYRPLRNAPRLAPLITAIGVSFILQNIVQIIYGPFQTNTPQVFPTDAFITVGDVKIPVLSIFIIAVALGLMIGLQLFVGRTRIGRAMRSTALDRDAAALMGVNINRTIAITFFIGSALAGAAGVTYGLQYGVTRFDLGFQAGLKAFTAAVLGGIGNTVGAALGGFIIGFIEVGAAVAGYTRWGPAVVFGVARHRPRLPAGRPARPAGGRARMSVVQDVARPDRGRPACGPAPASSARRHRSLTIVISAWRSSRPSCPCSRAVPPFSLVPDPERLDRRLHERRRLRAPRPRPQPRRRRGRPARPRLRGVLRDRRLRLRVRRVAVRQRDPRDRRPAALGDAAGLIFWPMLIIGALVAATFGILLGAPTLRLRGDYLAIVTLGFGEIVPIVFLNSDELHERHQRHRRHLPAVPAGRRLVLDDRSVAVLPDDDRPHHDRHDLHLPARREPDRARLGGDPRGRAGRGGERHQHRHDEAPGLRPRRLDGRASPASSTPRS